MSLLNRLTLATIMLAGSVCAQDDHTLVAYWSFDDGVGDVAADQSGHGNPGQIVGAQWSTGVFGSCLEFDGQNDYVIVPDAASLDIQASELTVMAWINSPAFQYAGWVVGKGETPHDDLIWGMLTMADGSVRYWIKSGDVRWEQVNVFADLPTNTWQHVAVVYDGNYMKFCLNGMAIDSFPKTGSMNINDDPIYIGRDGWDQDNFFHGQIDEVKLFSRALTECEIQMEMASAPMTSSADVNADCSIDISDLTYMVGFMFRGGPPPATLSTKICNCGK